MSEAPSLALPVLLACDPQTTPRIRNHVEAVLGWQAVDAEAARWMAPRLVLADGAVPVPSIGAPVVLVVAEGSSPSEVARAAARLGAVDAVAWPGGRDELVAVAGRAAEAVPDWRNASGRDGVAGGRGPGGGAARVGLGVGAPEVDRGHLAVAGAAGGVGATTVALAIGALAAWQGREVLAVVLGDVPVPDVPAVAADALGAPGVWGLARVAPAAPSLRVVRRGGPDGVASTAVLQVGGLLVEEVGVRPDLADILVARRDRAGAEAIASCAAPAIVLLDEGPLEEGRVLAGATSGTVVVLPRSARVARAGAALRVPGGLPGSWLEPLRSLLPGASPQPVELGPRRRWRRS